MTPATFRIIRAVTPHLFDGALVYGGLACAFLLLVGVFS